MTYYYYKAISASQSRKQLEWENFKRRMVRLLPNVLIVVGATAILSVGYPMLSYKMTAQKWQQKKIASPLDSNQTDSLKQIASKSKTFGDNTTPVQAAMEPVIVDGIDYTKADNWFTGTKPVKSPSQFVPVTSYTLSIPTLNIKDMIVEIGGQDLDKHLIHYAGTALPGQYGNPVIFGHSVLPVFYNPKSYVSVFSKLPTLDEGDEIYVNFDGIEYRYIVESYHEVRPDQVDVLEQRYDRQTITLITCVPPGTYTRRGVIMGVLEKL